LCSSTRHAPAHAGPAAPAAAPAQAESLRRLKLPACGARAGRPILGVVVVLDLEGLSLVQFAAAKDFLAEISRLDQDGAPGSPWRSGIARPCAARAWFWAAARGPRGGRRPAARARRPEVGGRRGAPVHSPP
jgi:hypothetical protein